MRFYQISRKELPEILVLVDSLHEELLVGVLEGEIERLRGEVAHHVDHVSTPVGQEALLPEEEMESSQSC